MSSSSLSSSSSCLITDVSAYDTRPSVNRGHRWEIPDEIPWAAQDYNRSVKLSPIRQLISGSRVWANRLLRTMAENRDGDTRVELGYGWRDGRRTVVYPAPPK